MFELHPTLAADTHSLAHWPLCQVLLLNDAQYPWLILVPAREGLENWHDLDEGDQMPLMSEIRRASQWLTTCFHPDKINVAALGNMVPQLHIHVIARFRDDPAWPKPVWGSVPSRPYAPELLGARVAAWQAYWRGEG